MKMWAPMKYILSFLLMVGVAHASEEIEVGTPQDCLVVGSTDDQAIADELNYVQQQITDCLAPQEEQITESGLKTHPEVVSQ